MDKRNFWRRLSIPALWSWPVRMQKLFKSCSGNGRTRPIAVSCPLTRSIVTPSGKTIMVDRRNRLSRVVVRRELSYRGQKCTISNAFIGVASYGALGHVPLLDFQQFIFGTLLWSCIKCHCHISFLCPMSSGFFVQQLSKLSLLFFFILLENMKRVPISWNTVYLCFLILCVSLE